MEVMTPLPLAHLEKYLLSPSSFPFLPSYLKIARTFLVTKALHDLAPLPKLPSSLTQATSSHHEPSFHSLPSSCPKAACPFILNAKLPSQFSSLSQAPSVPFLPFFPESRVSHLISHKSSLHDSFPFPSSLHPFSLKAHRPPTATLRPLFSRETLPHSSSSLSSSYSSTPPLFLSFLSLLCYSCGCCCCLVLQLLFHEFSFFFFLFLSSLC